MSSDSLALSGSRDIVSSGGKEGFVSKAKNSFEEYRSPEEQINRTIEYNEMDFWRIQGGERKQPDYIVVFRENGKIPNMKEAQKASKDYGGLPIVIVDKDKCLEAEKQKVDNMMERYHNGEKHLAREIWQKVRNNRVTRSEFCAEIDLEELKKEAELQKQQDEEQKKNEPEKQKEVKDKNQGERTEKQVDMEDLEENYDRVTPQERKQEVSKIRRINTQIQEIVNQKEGEEVGR